MVDNRYKYAIFKTETERKNKMMSHLDILVLLIVVVLIFQRLRSVLGTRPSEEKRIRLSKENAEKLYNILKSEADKMKAQEQASQSSAPQELTPIDDEPLSEPDKTLMQIPGFNKGKFIRSAENAFRIITEAFNKGDTETLEMLVNKKLFNSFCDVIESRQKEGVVAETDFICFDKVEIIKASIKANKTASITVEFVSQQVNILRNAQGDVIKGDENYIQNITDVWTFEKSITSASPNWILVSTKK